MSTYCDHFEPLFSDADDHFIGMTEGGGAVTAEKIIRALGYTPASETDLASIEAAVSALDENKADKTALEAKADKTALDETNRSLDALWKLNKGISYDFQTDNSGAYSKAIPAGAKMMDVHSFGGKSIVWNQKFRHSSSNNTQNGVSRKFTDNTVVLSGHSTGTTFNVVYLENANVVGGHKYYTRMRAIAGTSPFLSWWASSSKLDAPKPDGTGRISTATSDGVWGANLQGSMPNDIDISVTYELPKLFDLTQMFGAGNEPTIEQFEAMFPDDYYPYNEGEIVSADVDNVDVKGRNLLQLAIESQTRNGITLTKNTDGTIILNGTATAQTDFYLTTRIQLKAGSYRYNLFATGGASTFSYLMLKNADGQTSYPSNYSIMNVQNDTDFEAAFAIRVRNGAAFNNNVFKPMFTAGSTDSEFSPYKHESISIPTAIRNLEGYGWSAGSVYNEVDFVNKKFIKRVAAVDMGTLYWTNNTLFANTFNSNGIQSAVKAPITSGYKANILNHLYTVETSSQLGNIDKTIGVGDSGVLYCHDSAYSTYSEFKNAMSGVYLFYELAAPIEIDISELLDDSVENIEVESGGTITFHQSNESYRLPVPNEEEYLISLAEVSA